MGTGPSRPELASRAESIGSLADWQSAFARDLGSAHLVGCQLPRVLYELIASYVVPELDEILSCRNEWKWGVGRWLDVLHRQTNGCARQFYTPTQSQRHTYKFEWNRNPQLPQQPPSDDDRITRDRSSDSVLCEYFIADVRLRVRSRYEYVPLPSGHKSTAMQFGDPPRLDATVLPSTDDRPDVLNVLSGIEQFLRLFGPNRSTGSDSAGVASASASASASLVDPRLLRISQRLVTIRVAVGAFADEQHYWLQPVTAPPQPPPLHLIFSQNFRVRAKKKQ